jgi:hypothetical protein
MSPLRLLIYDRTCRGGRLPVGLSHAWGAGSWLYRGLDRIDLAQGVSSWAEALDWLATVEHERPIAEIQLWSHGGWGAPRIGAEPLGRDLLAAPAHPHHRRLCAVRERLDGPRSLWWFRCCETFGAQAGHDFARAWTEFFGCRAAGHTYVIGFHQSGLHLLPAGRAPTWPLAEGLRRGSAEHPEEALRSRLGAPNTITCLHGRVPPAFEAGTS